MQAFQATKNHDVNIATVNPVILSKLAGIKALVYSGHAKERLVQRFKGEALKNVVLASVTFVAKQWVVEDVEGTSVTLRHKRYGFHAVVNAYTAAVLTVYA